MNERLPARVYWVRRAVMLVVVAVLGTAVVLGVRAVVHRVTAGAAASTGSVLATPSATSPGGIDDCGPAALRLTVVPAAASFPVGARPSFSLTIDNTGTDACLVDAGEAAEQVVITSGSDKVWSSQDCPSDEHRTLLLAPGASDTHPLVWGRVRSAPGCPSGLAAPGAGTYQVSFAVGGAKAVTATFTLGAPAPAPAASPATSQAG